MREKVGKGDHVMVEETIHDLYRQLAAERGLFRTMKDVFMWSVLLGFRMETSRPLEGKKSVLVRWSPFTSQVDVPLLKAVAIAETGELDVLRDRNAILAIAEEYANAGIHELRNHLLDGEQQPLWNLVELLQKQS